MKQSLDYLPALKLHWKNEIISGFTIFLIALPLCIGIALASGAPPTAGLLAGIIGGAVVSLFSSTRLAINGPAAGLIVIVLASVEDLGQGNNSLGFRYTLYAIFIAGLLQILFSYIKAGIIAAALPITVIHGMLTGIGLIIFAKQIHLTLGVTPQAKDILHLYLEIPNSIVNANPYVALISLVSAFIMIAVIKIEKLKNIPYAIFVVLIGVGFGYAFSFQSSYSYKFLGNEYFVSPKLLIDIPLNFMDGIIFPDFSIWKNPKVYIHAITIALVASIETLLTSSAADKMDPEKRKSDMNQELLAKGIGNTVLGLIGGLPIIAEVVRSSANIKNRAKTRWSNFFHGFFLFIFALFFPFLIKMIPLASLASLLVFVGLRLSIPEIRKVFKEGADNILIFGSTVYFVVFHDLLLGVGVGFLVKFILHFINVLLPKGVCVNDFFQAQLQKISETPESVTYTAYGVLIYTNILSFKFQMDKIPRDQNLVFNLEKLILVDRTFLYFLNQLKEEFQNAGKTIDIQGLEKLRPMSKFDGAARKLQT